MAGNTRLIDSGGIAIKTEDFDISNCPISVAMLQIQSAARASRAAIVSTVKLPKIPQSGLSSPLSDLRQTTEKYRSERLS
jgi:hypothetical protein